LGNKKAEVFFLCFSSMLVFFSLSPKGPPSCWRAKPIIKAIQLLWFVTLVEHLFISVSFFAEVP